MVQETAPIIAKALLYSICAGVVCYLLIHALLMIFRKQPSFIKYHMVNAAMIVVFCSFLLPLKDIRWQQPEATVTAIELSQSVQQPSATQAMTTAPLTTNNEAHVRYSMLDTAERLLQQYSHVIMWCYLVGLFLFSIRLLVQYIQLVYLKKSGSIQPDVEWQQLFGSTLKKLEIHKQIQLAFTEKIISPCIIGHAKAVILMPVSLANQLTTEQAEAILLHELAHYKQYDYYINLLNQVIKCVLFFNPFVWLLSKLADKYRELSCDETAIKHERNIELAETLSMIAGMQTQHNQLTLNLKKKSTLFTRVQALVGNHQQPNSSNKLSVFAIAAFTCTVGLVMLSNTYLFSTEKDNIRAQLKEISASMYEAGNHKFVVVDAILDSLITLPAKPEFIYMGGDVLRINGQQIPTEFLHAYTEKLDRFLVRVGENRYGVLRYSNNDNTTLTIDDILNEQSSFRQLTNQEKYEAGITTAAWKKFFKALHRDGLIQKNEAEFSFHYSKRGIFLNSKKLDDTNSEKYRKLLFSEVGLSTDKVSGALSYHDYEKYFKEEQIGSIQHEEFDQLVSISQHLFTNNDLDYIIVDAVKDGLLVDGEQFTLSFEQNGKIRFAGKTLSPHLQNEYDNKYKTFTLYASNMLHYGTITKKVRLGDIMNPNSFFRQDSYLLKEREEKHSAFLKSLYKELQNDKLADTNYTTYMAYEGPGIVTLNFISMKGEMLYKYETFIKKHMPNIANGSLKRVGWEWDGHNDYDQNLTKTAVLDKDVLKRISDTMFANGNQSFVIIDAIIDGYIVKGEPFTINYKRGEFSIDGVDMPADVKSRYEQKLRKFEELHNEKTYMWSSLSTTIDELYPTEKMVKHLKVSLPKPDKRKKDSLDVVMDAKIKKFNNYGTDGGKKMEDDIHKLVSSMHKDKLLDSNSYYRIEYQYDGVYVNSKQLNGLMGNRYISMLNSFEIKPGQGLVTERIPEGVAVKDIIWGNTTVHIPAHGNNLPAIADKMFTEGNPNFILAHALHDGVIKSGKKHNIMYNRGMMAVDGKVMHEPYQSRYTKLMEDFFKAHKQTTYHWSHRGGGITVKDLNDVNSSIRKNRVEDKRYVNDKYYVDHVIDLLAADGLIDTNGVYEMKYNWNGLKVNGSKLKEAEAEKYTAILLRGFGHKPKFPDDVISVKSQP